MKKIALTVFMIFAVFLSCASAITLQLRLTNAEIDQFIARNPDLPDFDRTALMLGEFRIGITTETLRFMFGAPRQINRIRQPWGDQEEWHYRIERMRIVFTIERGGVVGIDRK